MEIIVGALVSLIVQGIKKLAGTSEYATLALTVVVSLLAAGLYAFLKNSGYYEAFYGVLTTAGAFYAYIIRRF